ncbi:hypothetical protein ACSX1A_06270 [Pontibacter sp. MBLB2868]|uniref:hypothetical protein n=1 Tax=Pontibacter sp. MBLB2868 TaxID=3451555 RepID=UPI003F756385
MESIELTETNNTIRLDGSKATRSMDIRNVELKKWPEAEGSIKLIVFDEKDVPIYSQVLEPSQAKENDAIVVGKRFAFYDHLSVKFLPVTEGDTFTLVINFE